jgi:hypothetical protein
MPYKNILCIGQVALGGFDRWFCLVLAFLCLGMPGVCAGSGDHEHAGATTMSPADRAMADARTAPRLPRLPRGVIELKFQEFFVRPVGPRGLEFTEKLRSLHGRRVRVLGYMAHSDVPSAAETFMLTPYPVEIHDHDNHLADGFPASVVHVRMPAGSAERPAHTRGLLLLTGRLEVGGQAEPDGRVSLVRLELEPRRGSIRRVEGGGAVVTVKGAQALRGAPGSAPR